MISRSIRLSELRRIIYDVIRESFDPFEKFIPPVRKTPGQMGTIYVLHIDPPFKHARHYVGWTPRDVEQRLEDHLRGSGSPLIRAAVQQGHDVILTTTFEGTRDMERYLKKKHGAAAFCPLCREEHLEQDRERKRKKSSPSP